MAIGAGVGFGLVAGMTAVELRMGWVHPLGWFETVDPKERFGLNLLVGAALQPASQLAAQPPSPLVAQAPFSHTCAKYDFPSCPSGPKLVFSELLKHNKYK